jgi:hypothetical protein
MSSILISRFLLDLRHMNAFPNEHSRLIAMSSFQAASHPIQSTIINDFGNPDINSSTHEVGLEGVSSGNNVDGEGDAGLHTSLNLC